jgi:hypothetical protein
MRRNPAKSAGGDFPVAASAPPLPLAKVNRSQSIAGSQPISATINETARRQSMRQLVMQQVTDKIDRLTFVKPFEV